MNILLMNGLPEEYEGIPISADFRNMIQVDLLMNDPEYSELEKTIACLHQLYPQVPQDIQTAVSGLTWFFQRGKIPKEQTKASAVTKPNKKAFCFKQDANIIYSAFYATYGISLTTVEFLHWWEFMALFEGLPHDTLMQRIIYWRTADLTGLPKSEKNYVLKMRKLFALQQTQEQGLTIEQLEQNSKDEINQRFAQAQQWAKDNPPLR